MMSFYPRSASFALRSARFCYAKYRFVTNTGSGATLDCRAEEALHLLVKRFFRRLSTHEQMVLVTLLDEGLGEPVGMSQIQSVAKPERAERKQHGETS
jgi:hypothetical protein